MNFTVNKFFQFMIYPLFFAALAAVPAHGRAQQQTREPARQIELTDSQIAGFTQAHIQVERINQNYQQQLKTVTDLKEQQKIVEEANEKMIAIIHANGLNVELYNAIVHQVPKDPALKNRINQEIQRLQAS